MRADNRFETTGHDRIIKVTGIPTDGPDDVFEMTIRVAYEGLANVFKAVTLDHVIIPAIVAGINNDGLRDLLQAIGQVLDNADDAGDGTVSVSARLYMNLRGAYEQMTGKTRGTEIADLDPEAV